MLRTRIALVVACLALGMPLDVSASSEKTLAEHLLEILRADGTISEQRYDELREIAEAERQVLADVAAGSENDIQVGWKDGFFLENPKKHFKLQIGGRIQADAATIDEDRGVNDALGLADDIGSGTEFRRARLYVKGQVSENTYFKAQYDFAGGDGDTDFKDVYLEFRDVIPVAEQVRVGHFKEPFSLEELTSSNYLTFMERGLSNLFAPSRNMGIMLSGDSNWREMPWSWAVGAFRETDDFGTGFGDSEYNVTGRLTGAPLYADEGAKVLHLGLSYSHKFISNEMISFASEPEANLAPEFIDTGDFAADGVSLINPELALVLGPFSIQGEYTHSWVDQNSGSDLDFRTYYAQVSYFLTGEHRAYNASSGTFSRIKPKRNVVKGGGHGAWELAARYSHADLDDEGISGGELDDWTLGLNWYLNPFTRIMFNFIRADLDNAGDTNIFQTRFQVEF